VPVLEARPDTPVIVWVRDPRTPTDIERIRTLEIPPRAERPLGVQAIDCRSLGAYVERAAATGAGVVFASPAPTLARPRMAAAYGTELARVEFLPNPLGLVSGQVPRTERPTIVFLGRLDPIKRPWVFLELARRFPGADFVMLGQPHFAGAGAWLPANAPENVRLMGHVGRESKRRLLESAWMIVNTSIHESLPISFLEALHCGTPIVACQDPEHVTSRFGVFVGEWGGSGLDSLGAFADAVERLLDDHGLRARLGHEGREWVRRTHTREQFLATFARLADSIGHQGR
jgi:glycosyltransferase involved in cell wall biosynthesis